jgi:two-component system response regulator
MTDKPSILLVEDNEADEAFALRAFKRNNVANQVVVARDGREALDYLFEPANALPAFVLLDLKLPRIGGLEVLRQLRENERTRRVPVIVLTSSTNDSDLRASYALGGNSYVVKSLDLDKFTLEIGALARFWLEVNRNAPPAGA